MTSGSLSVCGILERNGDVVDCGWPSGDSGASPARHIRRGMRTSMARLHTKRGLFEPIMRQPKAAVSSRTPISSARAPETKRRPVAMGHGPLHPRTTPRKKEECRRKLVQDSAQWKHTAKRRMATADDVSGPLIPPSPTGAPLHIEDDFMARLSLAEKRDEQRMSPTTSSRSGLLIPGQEDIEFLGPLALAEQRDLRELQDADPQERMELLYAWAADSYKKAEARRKSSCSP